MSAKFAANLHKAQDEQVDRDIKLGQVVNGYLKKEAEILGCNMECMKEQVEMKMKNQNKNIMKHCCNNGVIRIEM